ncbi:MAG: methyltransferase domain-containing protein [Planctomycetes bacterium]|nr:methyltransferase domain-containing protein [Planctomycetota bacterium]
MSWIDALVVLAYVSYLAEITLFPVPSEASTWQLFSPSANARQPDEGGRLAVAQRRPVWHKVLFFLLPTAVCVALFLVPLLCLLLPEAGAALSCQRSSTFAIPGAALIVIGRAVTFGSMLILRRAQRAGRRPGVPFTLSRNPGLVGMFTFYIGLCLVFGSWLLWIGLPFYVLNMHFRVRLEEAHLQARYGAAFIDYVAAVPRYLGFRRRDGDTPPVDQEEVAAWFDETYRRKGFSYLRPPRAYPIFVQLVGVAPGARLLDVACGPGLVLRAALERGVAASGIDISAQAIALANQHLPAADAREGNAEQLPFADGTFDGVTCLGSIERFLDRERALREMLRVAKPDARFCFLVRNASTFVWRFWREGLGHREVKGHQDARTIVQWRELFARCGFVVEDVLPDQWPRQRWRQLLPWWRPRPGRREPVARPMIPLRWCNELVFVLRRAEAAR